MKYFQRFPTITYALDDDNLQFKKVKNIFSKVKFVKQVLDNVDLYYQYEMKDSDTCEIVAHKLYDDPNRYWLVMMANDKIDPYYDVPLKNQSFENYIIDKYGSLVSAQTTLHHYEKQTTVSTEKNSIVDSQVYKTELTEKYYDEANSQIQTITTLPTLNNPVVVETENVQILDYDNIPVNITTETLYVFVTQYEYELDLNESKRNINLVKPNYLISIENEFDRLMK